MNGDEYTPAPGTLSPKTAFVTGATGFLGLNLIAQLTALGWNVLALHRTQSNLQYLKLLSRPTGRGQYRGRRVARTRSARRR